jgi:hypothetical protein
MAIKLHLNMNLYMVPVPICDNCWTGYHSGCERKNKKGQECWCESDHDWFFCDKCDQPIEEDEEHMTVRVQDTDMHFHKVKCPQ